jgi:hypothetical protein
MNLEIHKIHCEKEYHRKEGIVKVEDRQCLRRNQEVGVEKFSLRGT